MVNCVSNSTGMIRSASSTAFFILMVSAIVLLNACKHDPWVPQNFNPSPEDTTVTSSSCDPDTVYFINEVLPIFASSCAMSGCHDAISAREGVVLDNYFNIMSTGGVHAGNPNGSEVYQVLFESGEEQMPPSSSGITLTQIQKDAIYNWILQGAQNNACDEVACDTVSVSFSNDVYPIFELHCLGCHTGQALAGGGIPFDNYNQVSTYADNGRLLGSVLHQSGFSAMPQGQAMLDDCKIATIRNWITEGTQDN